MSSEHLNSSWGSEPRATEDTRLLKPHVDEYVRMAQTCVDRISRLWGDIELPRDERQRELDDIAQAVKLVWSSAVDRAEKKKDEYQQRIDAAVAEIYRIQEELGEISVDSNHQGIEGLLKLEKIVGRSLHARYQALQELLHEWKRQRSRRETDFKTLQTQINSLKIRFGEVVIAASLSPRKSDISLSNLRKLSGELEECRTEKLRRERELAALLSKLRSACLQLGENDIDVAAHAHPSLKFYREALPDQFSLVRPSFSNQPGLQRNIRPEDIELDLSDETFAKLEAKIVDIADLRASREKQSEEVAEILRNLWTSLGIPEDDLERGIHVRALEGPTRLHAVSIERCRNEVRRLETEKASQLWDLIDAAREELGQLCEATRLPMPELHPLLTINDSDGNGSSVGKVSDVLSKLAKMIAETHSLAEKRQPILNQIDEVERSRSEIAWLREYEQDGDRYKGRDSTKKLNRALRAGRMRDKLPEMIRSLRKAVGQWEQEERCPFVSDSQDYSVVLENMLIELEATDESRRPRRGNARVRPSSRTAFTPPPPHEELTPGTRTAPQEEAWRHGPDDVHRLTSRTATRSVSRLPGSLNCAAGTPRRSRHSNSRNSFEDPQPPTPSGMDGPSSFALNAKTPSDAVSYNPLFYRNSPMTDKRVQPPPSPPDGGQINDFLFPTDGRADASPENFRSGNDSRLSRRHSPTPRRDSRQGRASGSTPSRGGTRSTGSSHRSLALEGTDGRPR